MSALFKTEAELCDAFMETIPKRWTPYPETAGFDILLVHETGFQIGVEAKLKLNAKVILQATESLYFRGRHAGPDATSVLVPQFGATANDLARVCQRMGVTVITVEKKSFGGGMNHGKKWSSSPLLPKVKNMLTKAGNLETVKWLESEHWFDQAPLERFTLPEYVPEVRAGVPAPMVLGKWKIQAMKVCVWVERNGSITRSDFKALQIDPGRWMDGYWLAKGAARGVWVAGPAFPADSFRHQHGTVYDQVEADFEKWSTEADLVMAQQEKLL